MREEDRIIRLEEELVFFERRIEELNSVIISQQKEIDAINLAMRHQFEKMMELQDSIDGSSGRFPSEKPPHYL